MSRVKADKPQANCSKRTEGEQQGEENGKDCTRWWGGGWNEREECANVWLSKWAETRM